MRNPIENRWYKKGERELEFPCLLMTLAGERALFSAILNEPSREFIFDVGDWTHWCPLPPIPKYVEV